MNRLLLTGVLLVIFNSFGISQPDQNYLEKKRMLREIDSLQRRKQIDSLLIVIKRKKEDTLLVKDLVLLSWLYYNDPKPDSALVYARQAIRLSEELKYPYGLMKGYSYLSGIFYNKRNYDTSNFYGRKALDICVANNFYSGENNLRSGLNNTYFFQGDYDAAMKISTEGLTRAEKIKDKELIRHFNSVLGYIMMKLKNFEQARRYFLAELKAAKELKDKVLEAHALLNLADLSVAETKFPDAIPIINYALNIYQTYADENSGRYDHEAYSYNKLAEAYKLMHKDSIAIQYCLRAIELVVSPNRYDLAAYYINAGDIYNRLKQPDKAIVYLRKGLAIADSIMHRENLRDAYEQLSLTFAMKKKFDSAYVYQKFFYQLRDSILDEASQREIVQRDAELQIERQRRIQQAELASQQLWRNIIIGTLIFAIIIVIMLYNRRRVKQKILYQQRLNEQQNEMFNIAATVQDKERKRIAEDIHDGLGSVLSAAKLKLSSLEEDGKMLTGEQKGKYQATLSLLDEAAVELRNISHNIMPATLSKLGLIAALKNITDRIPSHSGLQIKFEAHDFNERLEESAEISIYRIVLELLNNVAKHAQAKKAVVQLIKYPDYINITVEDNGKGFDYKKTIEQHKGIGLGNIESRVDYLKGTMNIDSRLGRGTTIIIDIPFTVSRSKYQDVGIKKE